MRDLLGVTDHPSALLAPDGPGSVDQRAWDGYQAAAAAVAEQLKANTAVRAKVVTCSPSGDGSACAQQIIQNFGQRAFRRPLTAEETSRFMQLYTQRAELTATGSFDEAIQLIVRGFLLSPSFLTRAEISEATEADHYVLNGYEVASRLSYMLWGSMPDDALFAKAASGALGSPDGILTEAKRMLVDPKARARVTAFHEDYLHISANSRWTQVARDAAIFPAFNPTVVPLLAEEARRFFEYITFDQNGTFQDLVLKPVAFVNKSLAPIYGLDPSKFGTELTRTDLDPAQRAGFLTHAGFLTAFSSFDRTSPILRGAFVQKEVLCSDIPAPPADATSRVLPAVGATQRERVTAQTASEACLGCHQTVINPTGFALENYDGIGTYQTVEKGTGATIDTKVTVPIGRNAVEVTGAVDLMNKIAASPEAQACYAKKWVKFAYDRDLTSQDLCTVQSLATKMTQSGYTVLNLITDLTQSQSFRYRTPEVTP
ncbi:MAG TPA: DUF1592 domain-containing protein [Polyangiaceae bacterium]|nr:DUF1592 domain-containing protein [Polyangiaceae bacterium]